MSLSTRFGGPTPACGSGIVFAHTDLLREDNLGMSDVRLEDLTKSFKGTTAVDHIDLVVEEGEFFSLLGPSGCGKTTTLRMIGGFEEPTSGHVYLGGDEVSALPPYKRNVNTVFQSYALFPHLNVADNVGYGLKRKKVSESAIKDRVQEMLALVDLSGFPTRRINQLSGGQQQRVALARALVNSPVGASARRAAGSVGPQAEKADAAGAQADPAGDRDHVHLRHPRSGRSDDDVQPSRRDERGPPRAGGCSTGGLRAARTPPSLPVFSAHRTCSTEKSPALTARLPRST